MSNQVDKFESFMISPNDMHIWPGDFSGKHFRESIIGDDYVELATILEGNSHKYFPLLFEKYSDTAEKYPTTCGAYLFQFYFRKGVDLRKGSDAKIVTYKDPSAVEELKLEFAEWCKQFQGGQRILCMKFDVDIDENNGMVGHQICYTLSIGSSPKNGPLDDVGNFEFKLFVVYSKQGNRRIVVG